MATALDYDDGTEDLKHVTGGEEALGKLMAYLSPILKSPETQGDLNVTLYLSSKFGDQEIDEFVFEIGRGSSIEKFARNIVDRAENDALDGVGKFKYAVGVDGVVKKCKFDLKVPARVGTDDEDEVDELPNGRGQIHQAMRHTENMFKLAFGAIRVCNEQTMEQNRELRAENHFLKRHQHEQIKVTEQLRSMQFERDQKIEEVKESKDRKKRLLGMAEKALPVITAKLLGGGTQMASEMTGQASPVEGLLNNLISSLEANPQKLQTLMQILDPVELASLNEIHLYIARRREALARQEEAQAQAQAQAQAANETEPPAGESK